MLYVSTKIIEEPIIFTPVENRELLSKTVASSIEEAIRSKKIIKGNKLPSESELCEQFGVSRTALREALRMLSARDLITIVKGKGIYVKGPSADTVTRPLHMFLQMKGEHNYVRDVIRARQIIEPAIAAEAAKNRTEEDIDRLK
jgi:GntR family transcriptional repressor for pyruvate dehydrogenase complex